MLFKNIKMQQLISVDFKGDFGFFRKPDANNTINLSYNIIHKPSILGILGAIIGLDGYKEKGVMPEYFEVFKDLKIGLEPLNHDKGNFQKTVIKYSNTVGYANNGSTYLTEEATLIKPCYRVYVLLDISIGNEKKLFDYLKEGKTEYIPYFGKNEFHMWWDKESFKEYNFNLISNLEKAFRIKSIFSINEGSPPAIDFEQEESARRRDNTLGLPFIYFERIPMGFDNILFQYKLGKFIYSNYLFKKDLIIDNLYQLENDIYVQLH
jgi:CRISPR-associated protein Cas5h